MSHLMLFLPIAFWTLLLLYIVLLMHELIHLAFVKIFNKQLLSFKINFYGGKVRYINDKKYGEILLISAAPNIILPILGSLVLLVDGGFYFDLFAVFCLVNLLNLLPFTEDGRVILYCLLNMVRV